jgi:hypothetical protein
MDNQRKLKVVEKVSQAFSHRPLPERVGVIGVPGDNALKQIEKEFEGMPRDKMTQKNASALIIDSTLILPEAFWYFLPKIAELIVLGTGDYYMFANRLEDLGTDSLNALEIEAHKELLQVLRDLEGELNNAE